MVPLGLNAGWLRAIGGQEGTTRTTGATTMEKTAQQLAQELTRKGLSPATLPLCTAQHSVMNDAG